MSRMSYSTHIEYNVKPNSLMHKTMLASYEDVCFKLPSQAFPLFGIRDVGIGNEHTK